LVVPTIISPAGTYYEQYYPQFLLEGFPYSGIIGGLKTVEAVRNVNYVTKKWVYTASGKYVGKRLT
jgi:hypothetical protein